MIDRGVFVAATIPAAAIAQGATLSTSVPTVWHALGYPFEAASMMAALGACLMVRWAAAVKDLKHYRLTLDAPVSVLALIFTAAMILKLRPEPIFAALTGIGVGMTGAGLMAIGKGYVDKWLGPLAGGQPARSNERTEP